MSLESSTNKRPAPGPSVSCSTGRPAPGLHSGGPWTANPAPSGFRLPLFAFCSQQATCCNTSIRRDWACALCGIAWRQHRYGRPGYDAERGNSQCHAARGSAWLPKSAPSCGMGRDLSPGVALRIGRAATGGGASAKQETRGLLEGDTAYSALFLRCMLSVWLHSSSLGGVEVLFSHLASKVTVQ